MDYKKLSTIIFMVSGVATVVWGMLANDWSKCWLAAVIGGVIGVAVGMFGEKDKKCFSVSCRLHSAEKHL